MFLFRLEKSGYNSHLAISHIDEIKISIVIEGIIALIWLSPILDIE